MGRGTQGRSGCRNVVDDEHRRSVSASDRAQIGTASPRTRGKAGLRTPRRARETGSRGYREDPGHRPGEHLAVIDTLRPEARAARGNPRDEIDGRRRARGEGRDVRRDRREEATLTPVLRPRDELARRASVHEA
jgi:hypothetical protein